MSKEIINEDGLLLCPECRSRRVTEILQASLVRMCDVNTRKIINPYTGKRYMSNRDKAMAYDEATGDSIGCCFYECRKCGWKSEIIVE